MVDRTLDIISQVRTYIGEVTTIEPQMLYNRANRVQNLILSELKPEVIVNLYGADYVDYFDFGGEKIYLVKKILTNWGANLTRVDNQKWDEYKDQTDIYPLYYTIFSDKYYLAPKPTSGQDINIWAHQLSLFNKMTDDIEPEVPGYADEALILGTAARYNPEFEKMFRAELDRILPFAHIKDTNLRSFELNW